MLRDNKLEQITHYFQAIHFQSKLGMFNARKRQGKISPFDFLLLFLFFLNYGNKSEYNAVNSFKKLSDCDLQNFEL